MNSKRLFFALWPTGRQRGQLQHFVAPVLRTLEGRAVEPKNWHVTLAFIGSFPENGIPMLQEEARAIVVSPFCVEFDALDYWPRPKIASLVARAVPAELQALVEQVNAVLFRAGVAVENRRYRPHITLVRKARPFKPRRFAQPLATKWASLALVESISKPGGVMYRPIDQ
jgi:2'-5' RNA ligase